jgi:outer membrane protein, heavy metal efflux system
MYFTKLMAWRQQPLVPAFCLAVGLLGVPALAAAPQPSASADIRRFAAAVVEQHPAVLQAEAELESARRRLDAADRPIYNPELSVEYQDTGVREQSIGVSQTLDWSDLRGARTDTARAAAAAAEARFSIQREVFVRDLLTTLIEFRSAEKGAALAAQRAELVRRFESIATDRRRAGDLDQISVDLAILARSEADMARARADSVFAAARERLAAFTGLREGWPALPSDVPEIVGAPTAEEVNDLPRMRFASASLEAASATVVMRERERRPDPTFGLRAGTEGADDLIGLEFSIPLFVRNRYRAEVGEATADRRAAAARLETERRAVLADIGSASARFRAVSGAWNNWSASGRNSLERQMQTLERLWQLGDLSATEYLIQLRQALDTQGAALELEQEVWDAWFAWLEHSARGSQWVGLTTAASRARP